MPDGIGSIPTVQGGNNASTGEKSLMPFIRNPCRTAVGRVRPVRVHAAAQQVGVTSGLQLAPSPIEHLVDARPVI